MLAFLFTKIGKTSKTLPIFLLKKKKNSKLERKREKREKLKIQRKNPRGVVGFHQETQAKVLKIFGTHWRVEGRLLEDQGGREFSGPKP